MARPADAGRPGRPVDVDRLAEAPIERSHLHLLVTANGAGLADEGRRVVELLALCQHAQHVHQSLSEG